MYRIHYARRKTDHNGDASLRLSNTLIHFRTVNLPYSHSVTAPFWSVRPPQRVDNTTPRGASSSLTHLSSSGPLGNIAA